VDPYLFAVPRRGVERLLPRAKRGIAVDSVTESREAVLLTTRVAVPHAGLP
jgi:hypothetical protein